ncbi:MAG: hypothetical protein DWH96_09070 [Planctomycetota bacterium]|nr:MAG: hypothetical protein DWH96_09070 [Planctomycetota bacterium]
MSTPLQDEPSPLFEPINMNQPAIDIIGDVHGMYGRLMGLLAKLGYHREGGRWRHQEIERVVIVPGHVGHDSKSNAVIETVRGLRDDRIALGHAGNHETSAIAFYSWTDRVELDARTAFPKLNL